ncbi:MAG: DUF1684 domain-containing protein, partial [Anaerolineae bacterium]|nr:DUF1684 domain-containing protein [Anaerolineae bacterium]
MITETTSSYVGEIENWQQKMESDLRAPDSWLALVGLEPLKTGDNTIGSGSDCDAHLPDSVPAQIGTITVQDKVVTMRPSDASIKIDGVSVIIGQTYTVNDNQHDGEMPLINVGSVTFFVIERDGDFFVRVRDANSPTRVNFNGRKWYPVDPAYRVKATFTPHSTKHPVSVENSKGLVSILQNVGYAEFELLGETRRLEAFEPSSGNKLWFIFRDATSGKTTYGAGR